MKPSYPILFFVILFLSQCTLYSDLNEHEEESSKYSADPDPLIKEPGKCYAKALMKDIFEVESIEYILYTGNIKEEENDVEIEEVTMVIIPATTKWVKKKADRNCLSADPNDCLVWCLGMVN